MFESIALRLRRELIGIVNIKGVILESKNVIDEIRRFAKSRNVKAILLRIDSPGGAVVPSQEIYEEVVRVRKEKKVCASFGNMGTSGAYYIASAADRIFASPGTVTGSIGVALRLSNVEELLKKIGLSSKIVKSGPYKDLGSPFRKVTQKESKLLDDLMSDIHQQFVESVAAGRKVDPEKLLALADGRIFTGKQAKDLGLVDELGNMNHAIEEMGKMVGIEGEPRTIELPKRRSSLSGRIVGTTVSAMMDEWEQRSSKLGALTYLPALSSEDVEL